MVETLTKKKGRPKIYNEPLKFQYSVIPVRLYKLLLEIQKKEGISMNRQIVNSLELYLSKKMRNK